jgi:hypothetical protein
MMVKMQTIKRSVYLVLPGIITTIKDHGFAHNVHLIPTLLHPVQQRALHARLTLWRMNGLLLSVLKWMCPQICVLEERILQTLVVIFAKLGFGLPMEPHLALLVPLVKRRTLKIFCYQVLKMLVFLDRVVRRDLGTDLLSILLN